jgi:hypothetical protein
MKDAPKISAINFSTASRTAGDFVQLGQRLGRFRGRTALSPAADLAQFNPLCWDWREKTHSSPRSCGSPTRFAGFGLALTAQITVEWNRVDD